MRGRGERVRILLDNLELLYLGPKALFGTFSMENFKLKIFSKFTGFPKISPKIHLKNRNSKLISF